MKTWAFGAIGSAAISALAFLMACSSSSGSGTTTTAGTGAHTTTVGSASHAASSGTGTGATTTTTGSGGTGGGDPCTDGSDCTTCTDRMSCFDCNSTAHQAGVMAYNTLLDCITCTACYTTCDGAASLGQQGGCTAAPTTTDACDVGAASMTTCGTCQMCSTKSGATCGADLTACEANTDCKALLTTLGQCPAQ